MEIEGVSSNVQQKVCIIDELTSKIVIFLSKSFYTDDYLNGKKDGTDSWYPTGEKILIHIIS